MIDVTSDDIQLLLDRPRGQGMIVSCYADISVTEGFRSLWSQHLKNESRAIERRFAIDHPARAPFERDLAVIRHALDAPRALRARGMAIFSAAERGFFRAFTLGVPVKDRLVLDEAPYLVPLLEAIHRQRRYLVVVTDSHRGRLFEAAWGHTHLLREIEHDTPRRQKSAGDMWGKQQATIARHREDQLFHYRKDLVNLIANAWHDAPFRGLILLGDHKTLAALQPMLPPAFGPRVVHTERYSWRRRPDIDARVQEVLDGAFRTHDEALVKELDRRLHEHYLVAAGPQEVVNALRYGQVGYPGFIVLEPDRGQMATRCTKCESVFTTLPAVCPYCGGACERVNLWQEMLLFAARHHITAHTVESHPQLSRHGGVAAALSRAEPWDSAPAARAVAVIAG
jgi:hypothetical protein